MTTLVKVAQRRPLINAGKVSNVKVSLLEIAVKDRIAMNRCRGSTPLSRLICLSSQSARLAYFCFPMCLVLKAQCLLNS